VQNQTSPLILTFGATDPVGATGIQADLATFSAMGCHGLSVVTAIQIGDTARIEGVQSIDVDWVADQARVILEDMPVSAFKIGTLGDIDNISAIAEIVSDYPDIPLIVDAFNSEAQEKGLEDEDNLMAIRELLIPQATVFMLSASELTTLAETWREPSTDDMLIPDAMHAISLGCEYLFVTGIPDESHDITNILFDETGIVRQDHWPRLPGTFIGAGSTLSAAITAMFANGLPAPESIAEAQEFTLAAMNNAQRLGMGKLVLDHYFWAREATATPQPDMKTDA
jgi:hydroxymethylpyrimidine/phosphomethylpyrimidine kinase